MAARAAIARVRLLGILHAAVAGRRQVRIALVILLGKSCVGLVDLEVARAVSITDCWASSCACLLAIGGLRGLDIGLGLVERDLEVAVVDSRQNLAGLHPLVVADEHRGDVAGDLRARSWCCRP